jgi:peptidoglycan/xylan/chitin deacetylase (PgdA/CDA1 family)
LLVDAVTGERMSAPSEAQVRRLADHWFTGGEKLLKVSLIHKIPGEIRGRKPPLWRADFGGWNKPTLYFSPQTGELVSRRHELWRVFDFVWMLHIMDYETRDNVNNTLLRVFTWAAVVMALSGAWLLVYSFPGRKRRKARP